jgi:hypothetical protein
MLIGSRRYGPLSDAIQPALVDALLDGLLDIYETAFAGRVRSCYVENT